MNVTRQSVKNEPPIRIGETIDGKYLVESFLHEDEHSVLAAARHRVLGQDWVIKALRVEVADEFVTQRLIDQTMIARRITSDHMTKPSDIGQLPNGSAYVLMERLHGYHLGKLVASRVPVIDEDAIDYVLQACQPLAIAHQYGQAHGNLRPACLFRALRENGPPIIKLTGMIDTLRPPHASPAADIHALGTLIETLRGGRQPKPELGAILTRCRAGGFREIREFATALTTLRSTISA